METEKLGIYWNEKRPKKGTWRVANISGMYHTLFRDWWNHFGLDGFGLVVGEEGGCGESVKAKLKAEYPGIEGVFSVGFRDSDINCDIQKEIPIPKKCVDWVICQAVLEHLADPFGAMRNMFDVLVIGGRGFFHTVGPGYKYHPHPIDCLRFFRDAFIEWERLAGNVEIEDLLWTPWHCFVVYNRSS